MPTSVRSRKQREALFHRQGGKCYWCGHQMTLRPYGNGGRLAPEDCTLDHINPRMHPDRGSDKIKYSHVAACNKCNAERNRAFTASLGADTLRALSRQHKGR